MEFLFPFRFGRMYDHLHVILHLLAKFCSNRSYDVISIFQDGGYTVGNLLPGRGLVTVSVQEGGNLLAC